MSTRLPDGAVFERILDQVLEHANQFVAIAGNTTGIRRVDLDRYAAIARQRLQAVGDLADDRREIDHAYRGGDGH